jgi:hypothetical protein
MIEAGAVGVVDWMALGREIARAASGMTPEDLRALDAPGFLSTEARRALEAALPAAALNRADQVREIVGRLRP